MEKTIHMTYKKKVPDIVFERWKSQNKDYKFDFSIDSQCIQFLKENINENVAELFKKIPKGMYKADLWRLCKLYIHGGVYSDVDIVPYLNIDELDKNVTFYSCLAIDGQSIFQAFMIVSKPKSPLMFQFLLSFLINKPYNYSNGPTYDMYKCLKNNLKVDKIYADKYYDFEDIKILIKIGNSNNVTKYIDLHYFPNDINYTIILNENEYKDEFKFTIENNILKVTRLDQQTGWGHDHSVYICIKSKEKIYLFKENVGDRKNVLKSCYVSHKNKKILDSRDPNYYDNKGW